MKFKYFLIAVFFYTCSNVSAQRVIDVAIYGAKPGTFEDAAVAVQKAIEAVTGNDSVVLYFAKGRYDFWPTQAVEKNYFISNTSSEKECPSKLKKIGLFFENKHRLLIEGNGSEFIFHGKMITFAFDHCDNIKLQNLSIDFERPTMSELTFVSCNDSIIVADVHPDSKFNIVDNRLQFYGDGWVMQQYHAILVKPLEGTMFYSSWEPFLKSNAARLKDNRVEFKGNFAGNNFHPGEVLTVRDPIRDHVGAFINQSENVALHNVSIHYMHGLGIVSQFSKNLHYDSVLITPSHGRQISCFADAMHFSGCSGNILIENCHYSGLHDDPLNVHGTHLQVTDILSPTSIKVRFMHDQTYGFNAFFPKDTVGFVHSASLQTFGYGKLSNAKLINEREIELELDKAIPSGLKKGDCIENITCTPTLTVRGCVFEKTNTRGLLVTTRKKVVIENNLFYRTGMHAILIADDATSWYESGPVKDVTIRNNRFVECGYNSLPDSYSINIAPENHQRITGYYVHSNIRIENNIFEVFALPVLAARSTNGLVFTGNKIIKTDFMPAKVNSSMKAFKLADCISVRADKNKYVNMSSQPIQTE